MEKTPLHTLGEEAFYVVFAFGSGKHVDFYRFGAEEAALTIGFKEQIY